MLDYQGVIPGRYNHLEEISHINNLEKSYFLIIKTSVNRVDSNAIIGAIEARARQHHVEF